MILEKEFEWYNLPKNIVCQQYNNNFLFLSNNIKGNVNINFKIETIKNEIQNIKFQEIFNKYKNTPKNENFEAAKFVPLALLFNCLLFQNIKSNKNNVIPTYIQFSEFFFNFLETYNGAFKFKNQYGGLRKDGKVWTLTKEDVYARLGRAYWSFVRELYAKVYLIEEKYKVENYLTSKCKSKTTINVIYDIWNDLNGVDILIEIINDKHNIWNAGIAISDKTSISNFYKNKKMNHRHHYLDDLHIELNNENIFIVPLKTKIFEDGGLHIGDAVIPTKESICSTFHIIFKEYLKINENIEID